MPGKHSEPTIAFRPTSWQKALIEERAKASGMFKKDFIARSCIYSNIVVVGKRERIQRLVDEVQEMQITMKEIVGQIQSGNFSLIYRKDRLRRSPELKKARMEAGTTSGRLLA